MGHVLMDDNLERIFIQSSRLWIDDQDRIMIGKTIRELNTRYGLIEKINKEPGVEDIMMQMLGRLANSYPSLLNIKNQLILDIACGSNSSKLPASLYVNTPFGELSFGHISRGYTSVFEPWFCRILLELGAMPVGVDFGDLEQEKFIHYSIDLGKFGALDFLPDHSFDAIQDSRLFGSPEFTAEFPHLTDRQKVAQEIVRQEHRLLKLDGVIIHSDAVKLLQ
jgi:hypothetical protein